MNTLTIVQARLGSSRLPGKVLADIGGKTALERVIERVEMCPEDVGQIVVATTARTPDNAIATLCKHIGVECYRSSEHDVLNRFYRTAIHYEAVGPDALIVRVTADCPLLCPDLLGDTIRVARGLRADYVGVNACPNGFGQEVLSFEALETAWIEADSEHDREHVVPFIEDEAFGRFLVTYVDVEDWMRARAHWRLTLDEKVDLALMRRLYEVTEGRLFSLGSADILAAVESDAALVELALRVPS